MLQRGCADRRQAGLTQERERLHDKHWKMLLGLICVLRILTISNAIENGKIYLGFAKKIYRENCVNSQGKLELLTID